MDDKGILLSAVESASEAVLGGTARSGQVRIQQEVQAMVTDLQDYKNSLENAR